MENEEIEKLGSYEWMKSRIPAADALVGFLPENAPPAPSVQKTLDAIKGDSRWYPVEGGHRVVIRSFKKLSYDDNVFKIENVAWYHEHCDLCGNQIPPMTLCYVTMPKEPYYLLCAKCFETKVPASQLKEYKRNG